MFINKYGDYHSIQKENERLQKELNFVNALRRSQLLELMAVRGGHNPTLKWMLCERARLKGVSE